MNSLAKEFFDTLERNTGIIMQQAEGLSHDDSCLQAPFRSNCFNWVLGHIVNSRNSMLRAMAAEDQQVGDVETLRSRYGRDSQPIEQADQGEDFIVLQALLKEAEVQLKAKMDRLSEADWTRMINAEKGTSLEEWIRFLIWHEAYHTGQTEILRQLAGTDDHII
ncbi:hypothetical protein MASR2M15_04550 [Anaerolineales bacterium]